MLLWKRQAAVWACLEQSVEPGSSLAIVQVLPLDAARRVVQSRSYSPLIPLSS